MPTTAAEPVDALAATGPETPVAPTPEASKSAPAGIDQILVLWALAGFSTVGWWALHRWYGLLENRNNTHFAFEKIPGWFDSPIMRQTAIIFIGLAAVYALAIWTLRSVPRITLGVAAPVLLLIAGPAIVNVLLYPVGALDVFNYMIELKLAFHYHQNPYLVTFENFRTDSFALPAFLVNVPLFYGPAWLLASWVPTAISGFDDVIRTLIALKVFNAALLALTALLIGWSQRSRRAGWVAAVVFLANPLVLFEGVGNAHNDVLLTVFLIGAMVALRRRSPLAGPLLALSALVKLYTAALAPLFIAVALKERWGWRRAGLTVVLSALTVAAVCAPYWGDGKLVDGLQSGLEQSQAMDHVSLFSLGQQYAQQREADGRMDAEFIRSRPAAEVLPEATKTALRGGFMLVCGLGMLLLIVSMWRGRAPEVAAAETLLLVLLLLTNLYAWYLIPVFALLALRLDRLGRAYIVGATGLGLVYYPMFVYAHFNTGWSRFEVHLFLALFLTVPILLYLLARLLSWRPRPAEEPATPA